MVMVPPRHGKLVADSTPVFTTKGWTTHGNLQTGDFVFGSNGMPTQIIGISAPGEASKEVEFMDGGAIKVHPAHEWRIFERAHRRWRTMETSSLARLKLISGERGKRGGRCVIQLPPRPCLQMPEAELIINPYVLGAWLGDGTESKACITHDSTKSHVINEVRKHHAVSSVCSINKGRASTTYFGGKRFSGGTLWNGLKKLGVVRNKHIPESYKTSSVRQRLELLAGLIDTDGHIGTDGRVRIVTVSDRLADDIRDIIRSLGWRANDFIQEPHLSTSGIQGKRPVHYVGFTPEYAIPTRTPYKRIIGKPSCQRAIGIAEIRDCEPEPGKCIQVEASDGLYCVGREMHLTHNSLLCSQHLPAWYLAMFPDNRIILSSYEATFAASWGRKARNELEEHGWRCGTTVATSPSAADQWDVSGHSGGMVTAGAGGAVTGKGGNLIICDDPHKNSEEAASQVMRDKIWDWWQSTLYTRLEPDGCMIVVQTRWHPDDLCGRLLGEAQKGGEAWRVLKLPAILPNGKALWPERYSLERLNQIRKAVGEYHWSALYQQDPTPREGNLFKVNKLNWCDVQPADLKLVRAWDLAATEDDGDYTAGVLLGKDTECRFYICDLKRGQWATDSRDGWMRTTAGMDGRKVKIRLAQDPGQAGKSQSLALTRMLSGYTVTSERVSGDKVTRADPFSSQLNAGNVWIVKADWNRELVEELRQFPNGKNDDIVDALSDAHDTLSSKRQPLLG